MDAYSSYCFGQEIAVEIPDTTRLAEILKNAIAKEGIPPKEFLVSKKDPTASILLAICNGLKIRAQALPPKDLAPLIEHFKKSFANFKRGNPLEEDASDEEFSDSERAEIEAFVPDSYDSCPCASGKQFRYCCKPIFKEITFAMNAAQEGRHNEALKQMKIAENKVGLTSEILCRYAICWSYRDPKKSEEFLEKSLAVNSNHPRTNYILGIISKENRKLKDAIKFYQRAIEHYPPEDKYHLNETYNNLGTAYYEDRNFKAAKEAWEKALVIFPHDQMVKANLIEFIYGNPELPAELRTVSPFMEKFLNVKGEKSSMAE